MTRRSRLDLGDTVNQAIDHVGQQDRYQFSLADDSVLVFDSLVNSTSVRWSLTGPLGEVGGGDFARSDARSPQPPLKLIGGDYTLLVSGVGDFADLYSFRLLDLADGQNVSYGTPFTGQLVLGNETKVYRLVAQMPVMISSCRF